ncbi:hypothetical protein [Bdellovibrio sp. KM01]|uniref:hypothetical protein n=1 Tax=Bdellovibrio sp. KM01 TaxID=2748865 RepID=UPI0015EA9C22|nr:hypothetical protein [Bdellovibrio sp. KM01]QLY24399.1 hypothetical protein HW988_13130 [Bdellovibrio sp. KM01]
MRLLAIGLVLFGIGSEAMAAGINCKNEAAGHALTQMIGEIVKADKNVSLYKFKADRPTTDDAIELANGDVKETYTVTVFLYKGATDEDIELPLNRTVRVDILNTKAGACQLHKTYRSSGE